MIYNKSTKHILKRLNKFNKVNKTTCFSEEFSPPFPTVKNVLVISPETTNSLT